MNILLTGSHGLIGKKLKEVLATSHHLSYLIRQHNQISNTHFLWEPRTQHISKDIPWQKTDAIIHLAGANIADKRWGKSRKHALMQNRVDTLNTLQTALQNNPQNTVKTLIIASAVGYYNKKDLRNKSEISGAGDSFESRLCQAIETTITPEDFPNIRIIYLRLGVVLSSKGGALKKLLLPFKLGLGGRLGHGHQPFPWVSLTDATRAIQYCLEHKTITGPVNITAPVQDTNHTFTKALGHRLKRPTLCPMPAFIVKFLFGEMGEELLLKGCYVRPKKLRLHGFKFEHKNLADALKTEL